MLYMFAALPFRLRPSYVVLQGPSPARYGHYLHAAMRAQAFCLCCTLHFAELWCERRLVSVPPYNREITEDRNLIFHFGVGGFHRSHQAFYLNELLTRGENWGIVGVGIMPFDKPMIDALAPQNFLYTLMSRGTRGDAPEPQEAVVMRGAETQHTRFRA